MATEPISDKTGYSLDDLLGRFDTLIERLATVTAPEPDNPDDVHPVETPDSALEAQSHAEAAEAAEAEAGPELEPRTPSEVVLSVEGISKAFGDTLAVDSIDFSVHAGTIFGIVGPNGAGKTTTLSMVTGLLRPDAGKVQVGSVDVWANPAAAKRRMGILPDRLMMFDRLTGRQLLYYSGILRGLDRATVKKRAADLIVTFGIADAQDRLVADYSVGMAKKVALAAAMIHAPSVLILDEPFESVDSVSSDRIIVILQSFVAAGGTVVLSSHSMDLIERICDNVAIFVDGKILSMGTTEQVRGDQTLDQRFIDLVSASNAGEDLEWLRSFSD